MEKSYETILNYCGKGTKPEIDQQLLEAIGGLRFALKFAADCVSLMMISPITSPVLTWCERETETFRELVETGCQHRLLKIDNHRPKEFLLKLLFRRHGATVVEFCRSEQHNLVWLVSDLKDVLVSNCFLG